jgi:hypothetical protein
MRAMYMDGCISCHNLTGFKPRRCVKLIGLPRQQTLAASSNSAVQNDVLIACRCNSSACMLYAAVHEQVADTQKNVCKGYGSLIITCRLWHGTMQVTPSALHIHI